jgi:rRNA processing
MVKGHVSIQRFSQGKLNLNKAKEKKTAAAHHKAKVLRRYSQLCKKEGIESSRVHIGPKDDNVNRVTKVRQLIKAIPFAKEQKEASLRSERIQQESNDRRIREKNILEKVTQRQQKQRQMKYNSNKKPNVGGQISKLLEKIKSSVG